MPLRAVLKEAFGDAKPWMGILFMLSLTAVTAIPGVAQLYILTNLGWGRDPGLLKLYGFLNLALFGGAAIGSFVVGRIMSARTYSMPFYALSTVAYWILMLPWLLVARSGGGVPSFFTLLPFSLLALLFVGAIIGALKKGAAPLGTTPLPEAE